MKNDEKNWEIQKLKVSGEATPTPPQKIVTFVRDRKQKFTTFIRLVLFTHFVFTYFLL